MPKYSNEDILSAINGESEDGIEDLFLVLMGHVKDERDRTYEFEDKQIEMLVGDLHRAHTALTAYLEEST